MQLHYTNTSVEETRPLLLPVSCGLQFISATLARISALCHLHHSHTSTPTNSLSCFFRSSFVLIGWLGMLRGYLLLHLFYQLLWSHRDEESWNHSLPPSLSLSAWLHFQLSCALLFVGSFPPSTCTSSELLIISLHRQTDSGVCLKLCTSRKRKKTLKRTWKRSTQHIEPKKIMSAFRKCYRCVFHYLNSKCGALPPARCFTIICFLPQFY